MLHSLHPQIWDESSLCVKDTTQHTDEKIKQLAFAKFIPINNSITKDGYGLSMENVLVCVKRMVFNSATNWLSGTYEMN